MSITQWIGLWCSLSIPLHLFLSPFLLYPFLVLYILSLSIFYFILSNLDIPPLYVFLSFSTSLSPFLPLIPLVSLPPFVDIGRIKQDAEATAVSSPLSLPTLCANVLLKLASWLCGCPRLSVSTFWSTHILLLPKHQTASTCLYTVKAPRLH